MSYPLSHLSFFIQNPIYRAVSQLKSQNCHAQQYKTDGKVGKNNGSPKVSMPRTCEYVTLFGKRDSALGIMLKDIERNWEITLNYPGKPM